MRPITVPRLPKGRGYKGPEFYGCCNTGMAPCIFHCRTGKYLVGPELPCDDAMQQGVQSFFQQENMGTSDGRRVWLYKSRKPAVAKFMALCGAQIIENENMRREHAETLDKARKGDMAAALRLGDY